MCLTDLIKQYSHDNPKILQKDKIGYKVFRKLTTSELLTNVWTGDRQIGKHHFIIGETYEDKQQQKSVWQFPCEHEYPAGYHIFHTAYTAKRYAKDVHYLWPNFVVVKVRYNKILAEGSERVCLVTVAKQMELIDYVS